MNKIETWKIFTVFIVIVTISCLYVNHIKSNINYSNIPCVKCGSNEVLDFGFNEKIHANENYCSDCNLTFYSE